MADLAQLPPTPHRSSLSASPPRVPKKGGQSASANGGVSKTKGSVRAKTGCYTCRIRRKKCDERQDEDGNCETCVRLRLQCLGFGVKRPDWMRDGHSVVYLRDKIKTFLASQGMIKGHSGSGPRSSTEHDPPLLVLNANIGPSSRVPSPPTPALSASSADMNNDHHPPQGPITSFIRDGPIYQHMSSEPRHYSRSAPPNSHPTMQELSPDSPLGSSNRHPLDPMLPAYPPPPPTVLPSSTSLVPISSSWLSNPNQYPSSYSSSAYLGAGAPSTFAPSYNQNYNSLLDDYDETSPSATPAEVVPVGPQTGGIGFLHTTKEAELVQHYMHNVINIQYMLVDPSISRFIFDLTRTSPAARDAVCLLSALHRHRMRAIPTAARDDMDTFYDRTSSALRQKKLTSQPYTEGDAMAGLHVVSSFLFSGGRGPWREFLDYACQWVADVLFNPLTAGPRDALLRCSESTRFIIKTTMWFELLASTTELTVPRFLDVYRLIFGSRPDAMRRSSYSGAFIEELTPQGAAPGGTARLPQEFSMLPIMGCDSQTFLAMAEVSALACWKEEQLASGRLSVPQLVQRGLEIERDYLDAPFNEIQLHTIPISSSSSPPREMFDRRRHTAEVFRASTRVYLHVVLSGDYPSTPEIASGVAATVEALKRVPESRAETRSVVRSVVFSICIAGCLTDDHAQQEFLLRRLEEQQAESVGNCAEVRRLMESVWGRRAAGKGRTAVSWREVMRESGTDLLLLV